MNLGRTLGIAMVDLRTAWRRPLWIMLLILLALRARVVPLRTATAVAVLGGIAPFFGSYEFIRDGRSREDQSEAGVAAGGSSLSGR